MTNYKNYLKSMVQLPCDHLKKVVAVNDKILLDFIFFGDADSKGLDYYKESMGQLYAANKILEQRKEAV